MAARALGKTSLANAGGWAAFQALGSWAAGTVPHAGRTVASQGEGAGCCALGFGNEPCPSSSLEVRATQSTRSRSWRRAEARRLAGRPLRRLAQLAVSRIWSSIPVTVLHAAAVDPTLHQPGKAVPHTSRLSWSTHWCHDATSPPLCATRWIPGFKNKTVWDAHVKTKRPGCVASQVLCESSSSLSLN